MSTWEKDWTPAASAMYDEESKSHVFAISRQHEIVIREWNKIFNMHQDDPPCWEAFKERFGKNETFHQGAPAGTPTGQGLYTRAQRAKDDTAPGSDGWPPVELQSFAT